MRRLEGHKILTSGFTGSLEPADSAFDELVELVEDFLTDLDLVNAGVVGGSRIGWHRGGRDRCAWGSTDIDFGEVPFRFFSG